MSSFEPYVPYIISAIALAGLLFLAARNDDGFKIWKVLVIMVASLGSTLLMAQMFETLVWVKEMKPVVLFLIIYALVVLLVPTILCRLLLRLPIGYSIFMGIAYLGMLILVSKFTSQV